ncbi:MAG: extracellular solute-binding protein [Anaerolineae bacterium]
MVCISRRRMLKAAAGLAVAGLVGGCGATPAPAATTAPVTAATQAPAQAAGTVKVVYWSHDFPPRAELDTKYIEAFGQAEPGIEVEYVTTGEYDMKLRTALAAGTGPDLFTQWNGEIGQFYLSGMIAPLEPTAIGLGSQQELTDQYVSPEKILAGGIFEGRLYGIPNEVSTYGCFINTALWQEAGLDPEKDYTGLWDDFPSLMEKLTKRDSSGNISQRGWDFCWTTADYKFETVVSMAEQLGAMPVDEVNYTAALQSEEVIYVMQYLADWVNKYKLGGPGYQLSRDAFTAGSLATEGTFGSWGVPGLKEANIEFIIRKLPTFANATSKNYFDTYAYFHMVNARATPEVQAAGWKLAYSLSQHGEDYLTNAGLLQPKKTLIESDAYTSDPYLAVFLEEMQTNYYLPRIAGFWETCEAVGRALDRCTTENAPVAESLATAQEEVTDILTRAKAAATGS